MTTHTDDSGAVLASAAGDVQAAIDAGLALGKPAPLARDADIIQGVLVPEGARFQVIDVQEYADWPRRKVGTYRVQDSASFAAYVAKHADDGCTELWADPARTSLVAVIDAHGSSIPGWGKHRVELETVKTPSWQAWIGADGRAFKQTAFAEFIEDNLPDVREPDAATMLELAQTFQAKAKVSFESSKLLSSGERQIEYREDVTATGGKKGTIEVPSSFVLALIPFEGASAYKVSARFRYRINDGDLVLSYKLDRPADVLRAAFLDIVEGVESELDMKAFRGQSA